MTEGLRNNLHSIFEQCHVKAHDSFEAFSDEGCYANVRDFREMEPAEHVRQQRFDLVDVEETEWLDRRISPRVASDEPNPMRKQLFAAVRLDDAPIVLQYVVDSVEFEMIGEAFRLAARYGSVNVVKELAAIGVPVDDVCPNTHLTAMYLAVAGGHDKVCEVLLDAGAKARVDTSDGQSLLRMARELGYEDVVRVLTKAHVPIDNGKYWSVVLPRVALELSDAVLNTNTDRFVDSMQQEPSGVVLKYEDTDQSYFI